jgi:hypothetical protein
LEPNSPPTDLSIATTIIHEFLHAYFKSLFDDQYNNGNTCSYDQFACLYDYYVSKTYNSTDSQDAHHKEIAESYIEVMASSLQEFQTGIPVINSAEQYYIDLAWGSLQGTSIYKSNLLIGDDDRDRVEKVRATEERNKPKGGYIPKGKSCK